MCAFNLRSSKLGERQTDRQTDTDRERLVVQVECCFTSTETVRTIRDGDTQAETNTDISIQTKIQ